MFYQMNSNTIDPSRHRDVKRSDPIGALAVPDIERSVIRLAPSV